MFRTWLRRRVNDFLPNLSRFVGGTIELLVGIQTIRDQCELILMNANRAYVVSDQAAAAVRRSASETTAVADDMRGALDELAVLQTAIAEVGTNSQQSAQIAEQAQAEATSAQENFKRLDGATSEIHELLSEVDAIASKTRLLALNAQLEAVKAGEYGRSFAVVAEEVKALSDKTAGVTENIGALLEKVRELSTEAAGSADKIHQITSMVAMVSRGMSEQIVTQTNSSEGIGAHVNRAASRAEDLEGLATHANDTCRQIEEEIAGMQKSILDVQISINEIESGSEGLAVQAYEVCHHVTTETVGELQAGESDVDSSSSGETAEPQTLETTTG